MDHLCNLKKVVQCPICGWWEYKYTNQSDAIIDGIRANDIIRHTAVLETYNDSDADIPIALLRSYIEKNPDKIYGIDPHKMAELVRDVFADFYPDCKVIPFGKTRDGGKDLLQFLARLKILLMMFGSARSAYPTFSVLLSGKTIRCVTFLILCCVAIPSAM